MNPLATAAIALLIASAVRAQGDRAGDYQAGCSSAGEAAQWREIPSQHEAAARVCVGIVAVLLHRGNQDGICPPRPVSEREGASIVAKYLVEDEKFRSESLRTAAQQALSRAFPCRPDAEGTEAGGQRPEATSQDTD